MTTKAKGAPSFARKKEEMCNTPEELPMSAEAFERKYPGMVSAMEVAAHRALATAQASGKPLANSHALTSLLTAGGIILASLAIVGNHKGKG